MIVHVGYAMTLEHLVTLRPKQGCVSDLTGISEFFWQLAEKSIQVCAELMMGYAMLLKLKDKWPYMRFELHLSKGCEK